MTISLSDYAAMIPNEKGKLRVQSALDALKNRKGFPIIGMHPWLPKQGTSYTANFVSGTAQAATRAMNVEFTASNPALAQRTFHMRAAGGDMPLDINQIDSDPTGMVRDGMLTQKIIDIGAKLFRQWFRGNADNAEQFDGADKLCAAFSNVVYQATNGAVVSAAQMDALLNKVPGANLLLANTTVADAIAALNIGVTRSVILNQGQPSPGMFVQDYKGIPILKVLTAPADADGTIENILQANDAVAAGYQQPGYNTPSTIARNTAYALGAWVKPTTGAFRLVCTQAGTTHSTTEPAWTGTQGAEDADGTAKFTAGVRQTTRVTAVRFGLDGVYGIHNKMLELAPARRAGAFEYNDMNWFMSPIAFDYIDAIGQLVGVKEA